MDSVLVAYSQAISLPSADDVSSLHVINNSEPVGYQRGDSRVYLNPDVSSYLADLERAAEGRNALAEGAALLAHAAPLSYCEVLYSGSFEALHDLFADWLADHSAVVFDIWDHVWSLPDFLAHLRGIGFRRDDFATDTRQ